MKTKLFVPVLIVFCALTYNLKGQSNLNTIKKEKFNLNKVEEDEIGYAQAVKVGNVIYISGSVGWGKMDDGLKIAYDQINKTLKNYDASFENVVTENIYTTAIDSLIKYKDLRKIYYGNDYPAGTWVEVKRLYNPGLIVEIEIVAVLPDKK